MNAAYQRVLSLAAVFLAAGVTGAPEPLQIPADLTMVALLENKVLKAFDLQTGATLHTITLPGNSAYPHSSRYLTWDGARRRIIALTSDRTSVVAVDLATFTLSATSKSVGARFRSVVIGPVSGSPYLVGDSGAWLTVVRLAPGLESVMATWRYRLDQNYDDWYVHDAGVSTSEDRVFVSYHGAQTGGLDWFDISGDSLIRCTIRMHRSRGCISAHGSFVQAMGTIFAAKGGRLIARIERDTMWSGYDTGLDRSHVMEIAIDTLTQRIVAVDQCYLSGSAAVVDLRTPARPASQLLGNDLGFPHGAFRTGVCGERIDAFGGYFVVSKDQVVQVLDIMTGRGISIIPAGGKVVDLMLVPSSGRRQLGDTGRFRHSASNQHS